jgi:predicted  nucleic acid-binding Zn-ribbon protein
MDIWDILKQPFTWGLSTGLGICFFTWKSGFSRGRQLQKEIRKLEQEIKDLQGHLNTQLKINAHGNSSLQTELEELKRHNENLRMSLATLQNKPGRAEMRHLQVMEGAVRSMREQAPGFAAAWERAMRDSEAEANAADSGLKRLVRRVMPGSGTGIPIISDSKDSTEG